MLIAEWRMSEMVKRLLELMWSRGFMADESDVRALIAAMREPTRKMLREACAQAGKEQVRPVSIHLTDAELCWRAMIDAALDAD
jgi:hypothetical protein